MDETEPATAPKEEAPPVVTPQEQIEKHKIRVYDLSRIAQQINGEIGGLNAEIDRLEQMLRGEAKNGTGQ